MPYQVALLAGAKALIILQLHLLGDGRAIQVCHLAVMDVMTGNSSLQMIYLFLLHREVHK